MTLPHILVTGEAGHGKDTVGGYLIERHGYVRTAFADALKNEVIVAYRHAPQPVDLEFLNHRQNKSVPDPRLALKHCADADFVRLALDAFEVEDLELARTNGLKRAYTTSERLSLPRSPRRICQLWGTEYRRSNCDSYWVDRVHNFIEASAKRVVICDGRFENECDWANANGLRRIHIVKPGHAETLVRHASENIPAPDARTAVIVNDRTDDHFASLFRKIEEALSRFDEEARPRARMAA